MLIAGQASASANLEWCVIDPPIQVMTSGGNLLTVNNTIYISPSEPRLGTQITDSAAAAPDGVGGTLVTVHVNLPQGFSQAHIVSSVNRYQVSSQADGTGGTVVTLYLRVRIS